MKNIVSLYLDMYEIDNSWSFFECVKVIDENPNIKIIWYNYKSFILENYQNFLSGKLDMEWFLQTWDINTKQPIFSINDNLESLFTIYTLLEENPKKLENSLILITRNAFEYFNWFSESKLLQLQKNIKKLNSYLFVL